MASEQPQYSAGPSLSGCGLGLVGHLARVSNLSGPITNNPLLNYFQRSHVLVKIEDARVGKSQRLTLEDLDLTQLPPELWRCHDLRYLYLGHNKLADLPKELLQLVNVSSLAIDYNHFERLPDVINKLVQLEFLNVSRNNLEEITLDFRALSKLDTLWCNSCGLKSLSGNIGVLSNLDTFGARKNRLHVLPDGFCTLTNLTWLTLEDNHLQTLPKNFSHLQALVHLNLNRNMFKVIPSQVTKLRNLQYLKLERNRITTLKEYLLRKLSHVVKITLTHNPIEGSSQVLAKFTNIVYPGSNLILAVQANADDTDSDYGTDWEDSMCSSQIDASSLSYESDDDSDNDMFDDEQAFRLSRYLIQ